jgi:hypothetical protein
LGELVKCKTSKIYPITKNSCQARHICPPNRISETLAGLVRPPGQTCPASQPFPKLTKHIWLLGRIPEAFPGHVRPNPIPQQLSPGLDISGPQAGFQRGWPDMSDPRSGHVRVSDTPMARFSWRAIKGPPCIFSTVGHSFHIANTLRHSLELPTSLLQVSFKFKHHRRDLKLTFE